MRLYGVIKPLLNMHIININETLLIFFSVNVCLNVFTINLLSILAIFHHINIEI